MCQKVSKEKLIITISLLLFQMIFCVNVKAGSGVTYSLTVEVTPPDGQITILNTNLKYKPGIVLKPGKYTIVITHPGYKSEKTSITIGGSPIIPGQSRLISGTSQTTVQVNLKKIREK